MHVAMSACLYMYVCIRIYVHTYILSYTLSSELDSGRAHQQRLHHVLVGHVADAPLAHVHTCVFLACRVPQTQLRDNLESMRHLRRQYLYFSTSKESKLSQLVLPRAADAAQSQSASKCGCSASVFALLYQ